MDLWYFLMELVMLLGGSFLLGALAQRLGQSPILGYLLAGTIIGPLIAERHPLTDRNFSFSVFFLTEDYRIVPKVFPGKRGVHTFLRLFGAPGAAKHFRFGF